MTEFVDDGRCFACGPHNADGLHLHFEDMPPGSVRAEVVLPPRLQGYRDIAHGGIVMMLLDEAMAHAARVAGQRCATAAVNVRLRAPVPLGQPLLLHGSLRERRRTVLTLEATVALADGTVLATAEGRFVSRGPL